MKRIVACVVGITVLVVGVAGAQTWVNSFGTNTRFRPPEYLSGYGTSDLDSTRDRLEAARSDALSQLSRKVRVQITSEEAIRTTDFGDSGSTRYVNTVETASRLEISGANFEIVEQPGRTHALAWIEIEQLRASFAEQRDEAVASLRAIMEDFDRTIEEGVFSQAERHLARLDTAFSELMDTHSVVRALDRLAARDGDVSDGSEPVALQQAIEQRRASFDEFSPPNVEQSAEYIARMIAPEIGEPERVMPLLYQDADFSSAFGSRVAGALSAALSSRSVGGENPVVIRGSYWPEEDRVAIHIVARDIQSGSTVAAAQSTVPRDTVAESTLEPANMDTALAAGAALLNDQIVDGGLDLEVWTDKGRDERALVYEDGEFVQFYFRVNQPAFLRLSYVLASGETVLLEDRFYIGIDRVNRVVALPYRFQVVPPFGVERLVVTAHTSEPPPAEVYPQVIEGQQYEVFGSPREAVVRTRGLVRETPPEDEGDTRVGEASLSITTVGAGE